MADHETHHFEAVEARTCQSCRMAWTLLVCPHGVPMGWKITCQDVQGFAGWHLGIHQTSTNSKAVFLQRKWRHSQPFIHIFIKIYRGFLPMKKTNLYWGHISVSGGSFSPNALICQCLFFNWKLLFKARVIVQFKRSPNRTLMTA